MEHELLKGYNLDIHRQIEVLEKIIMFNETLSEAIERAKTLDLDNYYISAGCITQTVWNYLSNNPLDYGIKDIDFVYFDDNNLDLEAENQVILKIKNLYSDLKIQIDIKNQARVHLWYKSHFGYEIKPYSLLEDAINTWPTTATAIGVRKEKNNNFKVYAPFGLNDLFGKIVRANKVQITEEIYKSKVVSWTNKWADLTVIPWHQ